MTRSSAILLLGYSRPDFVTKRLTELKEVNNIPIVVSVDGKNGSQIGNSAWNDIVNTHTNIEFYFQDNNLGLARHMHEAVSSVLRVFDNCFVVEDDVSVNASVIQTAIRQLEMRLPDGVITVGLFGGLPEIFPLTILLKNRFRKTNYFSPWGWGIQREDWFDFSLDVARIHRSEVFSVLSSSLGKRKARIWNGRIAKVAKNPEFTWDYQFFFFALLAKKRHLLPTFRSCENQGFQDARATNTTGKLPSWYFGKSSKSIHEENWSNTNKLIENFLQTIDSFTWASDSAILQSMRHSKFRRRLIRLLSSKP